MSLRAAQNWALSGITLAPAGLKGHLRQEMRYPECRLLMQVLIGLSAKRVLA